MRAGRSRNKRRKASTLSHISEMVAPLQGSDAMRRVPFFPMLITVLVSLGGYLGCQPPEQIVQQVEQQVGQELNNQLGGVIDRAQSSGILPGVPVSTGRTAPLVNTPVVSLPARTQSNLIIGSFNIQRLGPTKLKDPNLLHIYGEIIRQFDVLAIQEVTSSDQNTIPTLLQYVNQGGYRYNYVISKPVGRTSYVEQYVFLFDTARVTTQANATFVCDDAEDLLHREPYVARFATLAPNGFTFALINMHTDPSPGVIDEELDTLANVYVNVANYFYQNQYPEDDVILLGDLNAEPNKFRGLGRVPNLVPTIVGIPTNLRRTRTIDNILVNRVATREYTGRAGAMDLQNAFNITEAQAQLISDHQPVWAEFTVQEVPNQQLASPGNVSWAR